MRNQVTKVNYTHIIARDPIQPFSFNSHLQLAVGLSHWNYVPTNRKSGNQMKFRAKKKNY